MNKRKLNLIPGKFMIFYDNNRVRYRPGSNYWRNIDMTGNVTTIIYVFKEMKANIALQQLIDRKG